MFFIRIKNLSKTFDDSVTAVDNLNLEINEGEFLVLLGPSGCGKSTLLRLIAGLEQPLEGEILIDNQNMVGVAPKNRNIAMVFQEYALYPHMTVAENLAFPLKMQSFSKNAIITSVNKTAELVGLKELLKRKPKQLSGGQRQRVALGRALIRNPKVFLFDEPLSNLDFNLRLNLRREIAELQKKTGITSVYVTHDQQEALALGHRIGILNDGKLIQCSPPEDLFIKPANVFIAKFIGIPQINLFKGRLDDNLVLSLNKNSSSIDLSDFYYLKKNTGKICDIGIRAHNFNISLDRTDTSNHMIIPANLIRVENQGDYYLGEFGYEKYIINVKLSNTINLDLSKSYYLSARSNDILLFDEKTGERIYPL